VKKSFQFLVIGSLKRWKKNGLPEDAREPVAFAEAEKNRTSTADSL